MRVAAGVKTIPYGRIVFGVSAILFGVLLTMWHDADTWQGIPIVKLPAFVADIFSVLLVVGGFGMLIFPRTLRTDALILGFVTVVFSLGCIPESSNTRRNFLPTATSSSSSRSCAVRLPSTRCRSLIRRVRQRLGTSRASRSEFARLHLRSRKSSIRKPLQI